MPNSTPMALLTPSASRSPGRDGGIGRERDKGLQDDCAALGIPGRRLHDTRHTFILLARRDGARKDVLERITHNATGDIVDRYTTFDWAPLCEAVASLRLSLAPTAQSDSGSSGGASTR